MLVWHIIPYRIQALAAHGSNGVSECRVKKRHQHRGGKDLGPRRALRLEKPKIAPQSAERQKERKISGADMPRERSSGCRKALRRANLVPLAHQKTEVEGRGLNK